MEGAARTARFLSIVLMLVLVASCGPNVEALREGGDVDGLIGVLASDAAAPVRADAAGALAQLQALEALDPLLAALEDPAVEVRVAAAEALGGLGQQRAVLPLLARLDDDASSVADAAQASLKRLVGEIPADAATDELVVALGHASPTVRAAAAGMLGDLGQQRALLPLLARFDDEASPVRDAAAAAVRMLLTELDRSDATAELVTALSEASPVVRTAATELLGGLGEDAGLLPLLLQLEDDDAAVREASERAVTALVEALPARASARILSEAIGEDSTALRVTAARMLGGLGQRDGMPALLGLHADPDEQVRQAAVQGLATLVDALPAEVAVRGLHLALDDPRPEASEAADGALRALLAALGPEQAVSAVQAVEGNDTWLALALDVPEDQLAARTRQLGLQLEPLVDIHRAAAPAADGEPVPGTRPYAASDGFHPAVVVDAAPWDQMDAWSPTALRYLELVVTVDEIDWRVIEVCAYNGPDITRFQGRQTVRVLSAHDGEQIAERTFDGTNPRACRQEEPWSLEELFGEHPDLGEAASWLGSIINPPS